MVRILRWGSLLVLAAALVAAGLTYPDVRARILTPFLATPTPSPISIVLPVPSTTPTVTEEPAARVVDAIDPEDAEEMATLPAVVILPPTATAARSTPAPDAPAAVAFATTSLLPEARVAGPQIAAQPGGGFPATATGTPTPRLTATLTPIAVITAPVLLTPTLLITVTTPRAPGVIPTRDPASLGITGSITLTGPYLLADAPLYAGPGPEYPVVGNVVAGQTIDILGWYTEGTWYLLTSGLWLESTFVGNPPAALPLVFPTPTFTPSPTPTITPTPTPTFTPIGPATPSPTPTSLDEPICACSSDQYDCLGSVFPNRAAAQRCLEYCYRQTGWDVHNLDPNLNGQACENLP
jgi:hypothetical protein